MIKINIISVITIITTIMTFKISLTNLKKEQIPSKFNFSNKAIHIDQEKTALDNQVNHF